MDTFSNVPPLYVVASAAITIILGVTLSVVLATKSNKNSTTQNDTTTTSSTTEEDPSSSQKPTLLILFGTQTGTAESFAEILKTEATEAGFSPLMKDVEDITGDDADPSEIRDLLVSSQRVVFTVATYGEGEPTDSSTTLVRFLKERTGVTSASSMGGEEIVVDLDKEWLRGMEYAVFGLGNRQYEHFNEMGRFFDKALEAAGGVRICDVGLGNDDDDIEGDFETWREGFWREMKKRYLSEEEVVEDSMEEEKKEEGAVVLPLPARKYDVIYLSEEEAAAAAKKDDTSQTGHIQASSKHYFDYHTLPVTRNYELLQPNKNDPHSSTRHIELSLSSSTLSQYTTADNLGVLPVNSSRIVTSLASALGYDLDATIRVTPCNTTDGLPFPTPCTVRDMLSRYCDLTTPPRRSDLKALAPFATEDFDRRCLERLASKSGKKEYKEKVQDSLVGIADIVTKLTPSVKIPLEYFCQVCPRMQPRYYTIASSSSVHPESVHLTMALVREVRKDESVFEGVCSTYLKELNVGDNIRCFLRPSTFRLPEDTSKPIIMIGPGTGIAPMRALLQERQYQKQKSSVGPSILYFGCKHATVDYLYKDELSQFQKEGVLTELHEAFSRDQASKVYVQHLMKKNSKKTWELIDEDGAYVYVCGGMSMGQDVCEVLREIIVEGKKSSGEEFTTEDAKAYCDAMHKAGRFVQELWA